MAGGETGGRVLCGRLVCGQCGRAVGSCGRTVLAMAGENVEQFSAWLMQHAAHVKHGEASSTKPKYVVKYVVKGGSRQDSTGVSRVRPQVLTTTCRGGGVGTANCPLI